METVSLAAAIDLVESVPPICSTAQRVGALVRNDDTPVAAVVAALERDEPLRLRVLHLVNSRRSNPDPIKDLAHAIQILGFDAVGSVVRAASVTGLFAGLMTPVMKPLWRRAYATAHGARELARHTGSGSPEEAFTTGLTLNLGQMLLMRSDPEAYSEVLAAASDTGNEILAQERKRFGVAHVDLGYLLARRWQLPEATVQAIRHHHDPGAAAGHAPHAGVQYVADTLATGLGLGIDPDQQVHPLELSQDLWRSLSLTPAILRSAAMEELASLDSFDGFYGVMGTEGLSAI